MRKIDGMTPIKISICDRVDLYICNYGFRFWNKLNEPEQDNYFQWKNWHDSWQVYTNNDIQQKIFKVLDNLPDNFKSEKFYQMITF